MLDVFLREQLRGCHRRRWKNHHIKLTGLTWNFLVHPEIWWFSGNLFIWHMSWAWPINCVIKCIFPLKPSSCDAPDFLSKTVCVCVFCRATLMQRGALRCFSSCDGGGQRCSQWWQRCTSFAYVSKSGALKSYWFSSKDWSFQERNWDGS